MLCDLKQSHAELLEFISELEAVLSADVMQVALLARVRLQLSKASSRRKRIVSDAIQRLWEGASAEEMRRLDQLRGNDVAIAALTSRHVREWSTETIAANREGYRAASSAMRKSMRERIATERAILYPPLERVAQHP